VDLLIRLARADEYGHAEFQPGMEEVEVPIVTDPTSNAAPVVTPVVAVTSETDASSAEYTLLQKGLFLAVILGCVAVYMKMGKKNAKRYTAKSMA
jgi:peptidyl-prolyl cis-trans isomerase B (cyclophilin B)